MPKKPADRHSTRKNARASTKHAGAAPEPQLRIRMYRVGFGDCFLLSLPVDGKTEHILVDCGVHSRGDIGTLEATVKDIAKETGGKLALVIATHAHQDHISGFGRYDQTFKSFEVGEVWLPWTENPKDPQAVKLKASHTALAEMLKNHFAAAPPPEETKAAIASALENLSGNEKALGLLKSGISGAPVKYLQAGAQIDGAAGIASLSAQVLGPPRDQIFLARMNLPTDERFLRAASDGEMTAVNGITPFESKWKVAQNSDPFYAAIDERDKNLMAVAASDAQGLVFKLDQILNNTSIVTLFSYGGQHLLFPGDAQYGSWESWIGQNSAADLLANVSFYKVAHHGSFNATPKTVLEKMTDKAFSAMVSTQNQPWASIPLPKLMAALTSRASAAVRSDSIAVKNAPVGPVLGALPQGFEQGAFWFDCWLPVKFGGT
jgi:beta-lactamase superfamily II metal-dependent hydrolase